MLFFFKKLLSRIHIQPLKKADQAVDDLVDCQIQTESLTKDAALPVNRIAVVVTLYAAAGCDSVQRQYSLLKLNK